MKRIALLLCGLLLLVSNTAEARRRGNNGMTYTQPTYTQPSQVAHTAYYTPAATSAQTTSAQSAAAPVNTANYSTATAQGVANLMASYNRVGHFGGNPGYEGCGCGATQQAAYNICCYGNSGMATVDVGYAQGSNGMWYCCRRYR
jgi:hypothetical protein